MLVVIRVALSYYTFGISIELKRCLFVVSVVVFGLCLYFAYKSFGYFKLYSAILASLFLINGSLELKFDPIDECAHFEFVTHIVNTGNLPVWGDQWSASDINSIGLLDTTPSTINHESIHAPFYYLFLAVFGSFIPDSTACLVTYRIIGLIFVVLILALCNRLIEKLFSLSLADSPVCRLLILLTLLSPGYIYRAARLNNEIMVCLLFMVLLYQYFLSFVDNKSYRYWLISLMAVLIFLTKNTAIYCMIIPFLLFILHIHDGRKITVFATLMLCSLITLPWFKFNLLNYNALTGVQKNLEFAQNIIDPDRLGVDFLQAIFADFPGTFYSGYGFVFHPITNHLIAFVFFSFLIIFSIFSFKSFVCLIDARKTALSHLNQLNDLVLNTVISIISFVVIFISFYELKKYNVIDFDYQSANTYVILTACCLLLFASSIVFYRSSMVFLANARISLIKINPFSKENLNFIINISCIAIILSAFVVLILGSLASSLNSILSRYMYPVIPAICLLILNNKDNCLLINIKKPLKIAAMVMLAFVSADVVSGLVNKTMSYRDLLSDGAAGFKVSDLEDSYWRNGIFFDGRRILLDYSPSTDYSLFLGRVFSCNGEYAWIDRAERVGQYEYLYLKNKLDQHKITNKTWSNVDNYSLKRYNFYGDQFGIGKINGSTLSQSFIVKSADSLLGFSVIMATYGQPPLTVNVDYKIVDSNNGSVVAKGQRVLEGVNDNQWVDVLFQKPVSVKKDGKYRIEFTLNNSEDKMLTVYAIRNNVYKDGELTADIPGLEKDIDLSFGLIQN